MATEGNSSSSQWERSFALNMARLRVARGMSQNEFARRISERGLPFYQATVHRIESQERSVRLDEARVISEELEVPLERMVRDESGDYGELLDLTQEAQSGLITLSYAIGMEQVKVEDLLGDLRAFLKEIPAPKSEDQASDLKKAQRLIERMEKVMKQLQTVMNSVEQDVKALRVLTRRELRQRGGVGIGKLIPEFKGDQNSLSAFVTKNGNGSSDGEHSEAP